MQFETKRYKFFSKLVTVSTQELFITILGCYYQASNHRL